MVDAIGVSARSLHRMRCVTAPLISARDRLALSHRRWPSGKPRSRAFCRSAPAVRFMALAIFLTGDLLRECALSSRTSSFDQVRRLVRLARLLAISPASFCQMPPSRPRLSPRSRDIDVRSAYPARGLFQALLKDRRQRSASAVRERVRPALAIVRDKSPDRHGLHCPRRDSDRGMVDASRGAEQDHSVLCTELHRRPCLDLFPQPSPEQSLLAPFGLVLADPRARRGNRGSGLARTRKQSQAVIVGGVSLEAAPPARQDDAETASIIVNGASASIWSPRTPNQCRKTRSLTYNWESPIQLCRKAL